MTGPLTLIKIGGGSAINIEGIAADVAALPGPAILIHGANALRDRLAGQLGYQKRILTSVSGYTSVYSDDQTIELLMLAYAGLANKRIVEALQRKGRNAIGLTGLDGGLIRGRRNTGIRTSDGTRTVMVRDRSGKPREVNQSLFGMLLAEGYTPVVTVPLIDETGSAINAENDDVVTVVAAALRPAAVIQLIEAPGILADPADPASAIPRIDAATLGGLEAAATGRFKRKLHAIARTLEAGVSQVVIGDGRTEHPLADCLAGRGTIVFREVTDG
jgi:acetylglutamate/LysW-gamma-L-alpha-aminoadipate kinase